MHTLNNPIRSSFTHSWSITVVASRNLWAIFPKLYEFITSDCVILQHLTRCFNSFFMEAGKIVQLYVILAQNSWYHVRQHAGIDLFLYDQTSRI